MDNVNETTLSYPKKKEYTDIPYWIVLEIFKFHILTVDGVVVNELCCFGYFSRDFSRKIFFFFPSIEMEDLKFSDDYLIVDVAKLVFVSLTGYDQKCLDLISRSAPRMNRLEKFEIDCHSTYEDSTGNLCHTDLECLFSERECFPNVRLISLYSTDAHIMTDSKSWGAASHIWNQLKHLVLDCSRFTDTAFLAGKLEKIVEIDLVSMSLPNVKIEVPNVIRIRLRGCEDIEIVPGKSLVYISVRHSDEETTLKKILKHVKQSFQLKVINEQPEPSDFDFLFLLPKFTVVQLKGIHWSPMTGEGNALETRKSPSFGRDTEVILLRDCTEFHEDFFLQEYPKLKELYLTKVQFNCDWDVVYPSFKNLACIEFTQLRNLEDRVFRNHSFECLEYLKLVFCDKLTGENWNPMPRLKDLQIEGLLRFKDNFFQSECLSTRLEHLKIQGSGIGDELLKGKDWVYLGVLKTFTFSGVLCNEFWKKKPFDNDLVVQIYQVEINSTGYHGEFVKSEKSWEKNVKSLYTTLEEKRDEISELKSRVFDLEDEIETGMEVSNTVREKLEDEIADLKFEKESNNIILRRAEVERIKLRKTVSDLELGMRGYSSRIKSLRKFAEKMKEEKVIVEKNMEDMKTRNWLRDKYSEEGKAELERKKRECLRFQIEIEKLKKKQEKTSKCCNACNVM